LKSDRILHLRHTMRDGVRLHDETMKAVLAHIRRLWGYDVSLTGVDAETSDPRYSATSVAAAEEKDKDK
jgi:spore cortex formation protein SpoVR/YcgB (stage V sporulation)